MCACCSKSCSRRPSPGNMEIILSLTMRKFLTEVLRSRYIYPLSSFKLTVLRNLTIGPGINPISAQVLCFDMGSLGINAEGACAGCDTFLSRQMKTAKRYYLRYQNGKKKHSSDRIIQVQRSKAYKRGTISYRFRCMSISRITRFYLMVFKECRSICNPGH